MERKRFGDATPQQVIMAARLKGVELNLIMGWTERADGAGVILRLVSGRLVYAPFPGKSDPPPGGEENL